MGNDHQANAGEFAVTGKKLVLTVAIQHEWDSMFACYGDPNEENAILNLGSIITRQGRFVAFPNVLQNRVEPFTLADKKKPGHRKILAMFLVDPHTRVLSTRQVPPQNRSWWADEVRQIRPFARLPEELFAMIIEQV